jgi:hypothetical protein
MELGLALTPSPGDTEFLASLASQEGKKGAPTANHSAPFIAEICPGLIAILQQLDILKLNLGKSASLAKVGELTGILARCMAQMESQFQ